MDNIHDEEDIEDFDELQNEVPCELVKTEQPSEISNSIKSESESTGPSTTCKIMNVSNKAGMDGIDMDKINHIIQESSKGSKFYNHKKKRQEALDNRVREMKAELATLIESSRDLIPRTEKKVDQIAQALEEKRDLSRVIVHLDMDAFYASVEMRDNPALRDVPMAVGGSSMLCTSNYLARKFGIRAAMPGFIARKLCPHVVIVPCNFPKYSKASKEVEEVLAEYGRETLYMSMDEAYFDITEYLAERNSLASEGSQTTPEELVQEIREKVYEKTKLTASAGIAANGLLAKICGDIRKPNNQFYLEPTVEAIKSFMKALPIRKVCGIGNVTEQMLKGLEIHTCGDLWDNRAVVNLLFKPATASFLLEVSMGIGNSFFSRDPSSSDDRKSMSCERTFSGTSDKEFLREKCHELCSELEGDLQRKGVSGKTITLKIKTTNFEVKTRARSISEYTSSAAKIFESAWAIYNQYDKEINGLQLRLMGVRVSNLQFKSDETEDEPETKQKTIDQLFAKMQERPKDYNCPFCEDKFHSTRELDYHVDYCMQEESAGSSKTEMLIELNKPDIPNSTILTREAKVNDINDVPTKVSNVSVSCPVCNIEFTCKSVEEADTTMNSHLDECLNKSTVKQLVQETNRPSSSKRPCSDDVKRGPSKKSKMNFTPIDSYFKPNMNS